MRPVEIHECNETYFRFVVRDTETFQKIRRRFTYELSEYFQKKYHITHSTIIQNSEYLYMGLLNEFLEFCYVENIDFVFIGNPKKKNVISPETLTDFVRSLKIKFEPYWYQYEALACAIEARRHVILSPTSSGKSMLGAILSAFFLATEKDQSRKFLLIVPNKTLVDQMFYDIIDYFSTSEINIRKHLQRIHSEVKDKDLSKRIIITTWQSQKGSNWTFEKQFGTEFMKSVGCLVYDECHLSSAPQSRKIIESATETDFRIGLTGTLHDEDPYKNDVIKGLFGDVVQFIRTKELIEDGFATPVDIYQLIFDFGTTTADMDYQEELSYFMEDEAYINYCVNLLCKNFEGRNVLGLYRNIQFGERIRAEIQRRFPKKKVLMIHGGVKASERVEIRKKLEKESGYIWLATWETTSTGVSVKNLHAEVFLQSMKKNIKVIQAVGRLLRLHESKKRAELFDLVCRLRKERDGDLRSNVLENHGRYRRKIYESEEFPLKVLDINMKNK